MSAPGYFTFRLAAAVPGGRVVAQDIEPEMVRHIHHHVLTKKIPNVTTVLGDPDDPRRSRRRLRLRRAWLGTLAGEITKKDARLVLVEFKEGPLPQGPPESAKLSRAQILVLAKGAGLHLAAEKPELLPYQTFLVFKRG